MLYGFMGFEPGLDGFEINPQLPSDWPELTISRIQLHRLTLDITVSKEVIKIVINGSQPEQLFVSAPEGRWLISYLDSDGKPIGAARTVTIKTDKDRIPLQCNKNGILQLKRI